MYLYIYVLILFVLIFIKPKGTREIDYQRGILYYHHMQKDAVFIISRVC